MRQSVLCICIFKRIFQKSFFSVYKRSFNLLHSILHKSKPVKLPKKTDRVGTDGKSSSPTYRLSKLKISSENARFQNEFQKNPALLTLVKPTQYEKF